MTVQDGHLHALEPGDDPDLSVAVQGLFQGVVGLEVTVVQPSMRSLPADGSAEFHLKHVFEAFDYLDQGSADAGLLEQEDVIRAVVESFHTVPGCCQDSGIVCLD